MNVEVANRCRVHRLQRIHCSVRRPQRIGCGIIGSISAGDSGHYRRAVVIRRFTHKFVIALKRPVSILKIAIVWICAISGAPAQQAPAPTPSIVFKAYDPDAVKDYKTNPAVVRSMVNRLVLAVTGKSDIATAWASLVAPNDKIGIKISAAGGELFTTHHDIVNAIIDGLVAAGHPRDTITVWDRSIAGAKEAGYSKADGYQLKGIAPRDGYDRKVTVSAPVIGQLIWGDLEYVPSTKAPVLSDAENSSNISHVARILSSEVTKVINVPVMSSTETTGIAGCLYNMTVPNIDNWRRFTQSISFGRESLAEIYSEPLFGKKVVLNIMDGLVAQYAGGPQSQPNWAVHFATLYASKDPVAIDAVALKHLEQWRTAASLPSIGHNADYIKAATAIGLGNSNRLEVRDVAR
jgi:hypothetical protein